MALEVFFCLHQSQVRKEVTSRTFPNHIPSLKFSYVLKIEITLYLIISINNGSLIVTNVPY